MSDTRHFWSTVALSQVDDRAARLEVEAHAGPVAAGHDSVVARCQARETYGKAVADLLAVRSDPAAVAWLGAGIIEDACHEWGVWALDELRRVGVSADVVAQLREHAWWDGGAAAAPDGTRRGAGRRR